MKKLATALLLCLGSLSLMAQMDEASMKNWMAYMTPGEEHKMMASWNGKWKGDISMWMMPGQPPIKSEGTMVNTTLLGDRYLQGKHSGSFNGMPFEGMSMLAFDNAKKVFISSWIDNMGTGVMTLEGPWDAEKKSIVLKGKMIDPVTGKELDVREVFHILGPDKQTMEMYISGPEGSDFKTMEITYTRQ